MRALPACRTKKRSKLYSVAVQLDVVALHGDAAARQVRDEISHLKNRGLLGFRRMAQRNAQSREQLTA